MSVVISALLDYLNNLKKRQVRTRPVSRKTMSTSRKQPQKTLHAESYDFSETGQLGALIDEIQKGELPKPIYKKAWEPDFSGWSPEKAGRGIKEAMGLTSPQSTMKRGPLEGERYNFSGFYKRPCTASIQPASYMQPLTEEDKRLRSVFGVGSTRRAFPKPLTPEERSRLVQEALKGPDFGTYDIRPTRIEPSPYKTREEMFSGSVPKPQPEKTEQDKLTELIKHECYDFGP